MRWPLFIAIVLTVGVVTLPVRAEPGYLLRHVALSGQPAPGADPGDSFTAFGSPTMNDLGQVAFPANVVGPAGGNNRLFFEQPSGLQLVAQTGVDQPNLPGGVHIQSFSRIVPNNTGQVAFSADLSGSGVSSGNDTAAILFDGNALDFQLREGDPVPGLSPPRTAGWVRSLRFNGGYIGARTTLSPGAENVVLVGTPGSFAIPIREGMPAPGHPTGSVIQSMTVQGSNWLYQLNEKGDISLRTTVQLPSGSRPRAIYRTQGRALDLVAKVGDGAPTSTPGTTFTGFGEPSMNNSGVSAFYGVTEGTTGPSPQGIWAGTPGDLRSVVDPGQSHPDLPAGQYIYWFPGWNAVINDPAEVAFAAYLGGTGVTNQNDGSLWAEIDGQLGLIAREGETPPGLSDEISFGTFVAAPDWSDSGQMSFYSTLRGPGLTGDNNTTLWLTDEHGTPVLIAWQGHPFDLGGGDVRIIDEISTWVNQGSNNFGRSVGLNDLGDLAFTLRFTDGTSGVFVARIPEPPTVVILLLVAGYVVRYPRRRSD
jgi:hypothetical protein